MTHKTNPVHLARKYMKHYNIAPSNTAITNRNGSKLNYKARTVPSTVRWTHSWISYHSDVHNYAKTATIHCSHHHSTNGLQEFDVYGWAGFAGHVDLATQFKSTSCLISTIQQDTNNIKNQSQNNNSQQDQSDRGDVQSIVMWWQSAYCCQGVFKAKAVKSRCHEQAGIWVGHNER